MAAGTIISTFVSKSQLLDLIAILVGYNEKLHSPKHRRVATEKDKQASNQLSYLTVCLCLYAAHCFIVLFYAHSIRIEFVNLFRENFKFRYTVAWFLSSH